MKKTPKILPATSRISKANRSTKTSPLHSARPRKEIKIAIPSKDKTESGKAGRAAASTASKSHAALSRKIDEIILHKLIQPVFQPIIDIGTGRIVGYEALSRFATGTTKVIWEQATAVGRRSDLELACINIAVQELEQIPDRCYLSLNISPEAACSPAFESAVSKSNLKRLIFEITENENIDNYEELAVALAPMRAKGARIAIDDVGSGYAGMSHIVRLRPDLIKLDISLIEGLEQDQHKRALASSLAEFAAATGSKVVAEGVETQATASLLKGLGVTCAQGYFYGRPGPLDANRSKNPSTRRMLSAKLQKTMRRKLPLSRVLFYPVVALISGTFFFGPAATAFAENAQPGETLWGAKLMMEDVRIQMATKPQTRLALSVEFATRRIAELEAIALRTPDSSAISQAATNLQERAQQSIDQLAQLPANEPASQQITEQLTSVVSQKAETLASLANSCKPAKKEQKRGKRNCQDIRSASDKLKQTSDALSAAKEKNRLANEKKADQPTQVTDNKKEKGD